MNIVINPIAKAEAGADTSICAGSSYKLSGSVSGGASSLVWITSGSGTFDNNTLASATYLPSSADIVNGSVILTITSNDPSGPCTSVSDAMTLVINPMPTVNAGIDADICSTNQYALNGIIGGGASSASWSSSGTGAFDNNLNLMANYTPSASDISNGSVQFYLSSNDPAGACPAVNDTVSLTIHPVATMNVGADATICEGTVYAASGIAAGGSSFFTWSSNGSGSFNNANSANAIYTPSAADVLAGSVILTGTSNDPEGPCPSVTDELVLSVTPRDNPSFAYSSPSFCITGSNPVAQVNGTQGGVFHSSPASLSIDSLTGVINLANSSAGTYNVSYTTAGSCPDASTVSVNITNGFIADFNFSSGGYCSNATNPMPVVVNGGTSGVYTSAQGLVIDQTTGQVDLSASTPGTYTITNTVAASGGCASASSSSTLTIHSADKAIINYAAAAFCHSSANQLPTIAGAQGGLFTCANDGLAINSNGEINVAASAPGTYPVVYTTQGICPATATVDVTINPLPLVDAGDERLIDCGANPIELDVTASGNVVNFLWNTIGGNIISGNNGSSASVNQTGIYYVLATNNNGCTSCDTVIVNESPVIPEATISSGAELTGVAPFPVAFANNSQNANTFSWDFGDGSTSSSNDPDHTFLTAGTYTVTLIASNNGRCADSSEIIVNVEEPFSVPEAFSPNGDGVNDQFVIKGIERFKGNKLVVFNRWGNEVHEAAPYNNDWDGSSKQDLQLGGDKLPVGTYYYVLDLGDGTKPYTGYIYLNR
jgi:gliding motility-associated-like protein